MTFSKEIICQIQTFSKDIFCCHRDWLVILLQRYLLFFISRKVKASLSIKISTPTGSIWMTKPCADTHNTF